MRGESALTTGGEEQSPALTKWLAQRWSWLWFAALALGGIVYFPSFFPPNSASLVGQGEEFFFEVNEAAGGPVLFLSLWLFYRRSHYRDLLRGPGSPRAAALPLFLAMALFAWGVYTGAPDLQIASAMLALTGALLLSGGLAALRAFWLPIVFLGFALPISPVLIAAIIFPMQLVTAQYAGMLLDMLGIAAEIRGDRILRPDSAFIVIETCSGLRTIVTLSMLTILMVDLFERRGWHAAILIALAPLVAFAVNGIRVVTLVLNPHSSIHAVHNLQGIAMLLVGTTMLYLVDGLLDRFFAARDGVAAAERDYGARSVKGDSMRTRMIYAFAVVCVLASMLTIDRLLPRWNQMPQLDQAPAQLLASVFGEDPNAPYPVDYQFAGSVPYLGHARHRVVVDGEIVEIHLGVANEQRRGHSILTPRLAWPASGYEAVSQSVVELSEGGPTARRTLLRSGYDFALTYSWIERRGPQLFEWFRQAAALDRSSFVRPGRMLAIRLTTKFASQGPVSERDASDARLRQVWARLAPSINDYARSEGSGRSH